MKAVASVGLAALVAGASLVACSSRSPEPTVDMSAVQADLKTVAAARILFAHQSVGRNILEGVQALAVQADVPIRIEETTGRPPSPGPGVFHLFVGVNGDPSSKIVAFQRVLEDPQRPSYDIAVLKFCYEDLAHDARDHDRALERYAAAVTELRSARPDVRLVHVTSPLRSDPPGWKIAVKRVLGRDTEEDADNVLRNAYNAELRSRFAAEPVFDLATLESTRVDGTRSGFSRSGVTVFSMVPEYTTDGGHLSEPARRLAAAEFLHTLAQALKRRP
jgi:hypothetical protein